MGGKSAVHRSRFQMDGLRVITDNKSTRTAWSLSETAWSTAVTKGKLRESTD